MVESFNGLYETEVIHHERPCAKQPSFCEVRTDSFVLLRFLWCAPSTIVDWSPQAGHAASVLAIVACARHIWGDPQAGPETA
jgi:hypothetical protein